jgi:DNA primase
MSRESVVLGALTIDPTSTSDLYERVGYAALAEVGLISYHAFRAELERLESTGAVASDTGPDGSTMWSLTSESAVDAEPILDEE